MSLLPPRCTCDQRQHGCSPPCPAHPELGGDLGNPGRVVQLGKHGGYFGDNDTVIPYRGPSEDEAAVRRAAAEQATEFADEVSRMIGEGGPPGGPGWPE